MHADLEFQDSTRSATVLRIGGREKRASRKPKKNTRLVFVRRARSGRPRKKDVKGKKPTERSSKRKSA